MICVIKRLTEDSPVSNTLECCSDCQGGDSGRGYVGLLYSRGGKVGVKRGELGSVEEEEGLDIGRHGVINYINITWHNKYNVILYQYDVILGKICTNNIRCN